MSQLIRNHGRRHRWRSTRRLCQPFRIQPTVGMRRRAGTARGDRWRRQQDAARTTRHAGHARSATGSRVAVPPRAAAPLSDTPRGTGQGPGARRRIESRGRAGATAQPVSASQESGVEWERAAPWRPARAQPPAAQEAAAAGGQCQCRRARRATRPRGSRGQPGRALPPAARVCVRFALPPRPARRRNKAALFPSVQTESRCEAQST